jgi:hypothetical protein
MKERPILFSATMVRALLNGSKTQTRRIVKSATPILGLATPKEWNARRADPRMQPMSTQSKHHLFWADGYVFGLKCPHGSPGDQLWVKETIRLAPDQEPDDGTGCVRSVYVADGTPTVADAWPWKRPQLNSIHCPRGLSRIALEITAVRVERLQEISEADIYAEGAITDEWFTWREDVQNIAPPEATIENEHDVFRSLWESINGAESWAANPWVWVIEFKKATP